MLFVAEMFPGADDDVVLGIANETASLLLIADKDFGELVFRQRRVSSGIILMRLAGLTPNDKASLVASVIENHAEELGGCFTVVTPRTVRVRRSWP